MWHSCFSRCSRPIGMKKLSYKNGCELACHAHVSTLFTGHIKRFIHTNVTRTPPTGIAKLCLRYLGMLGLLLCFITMSFALSFCFKGSGRTQEEQTEANRETSQSSPLPKRDTFHYTDLHTRYGSFVTHCYDIKIPSVLRFRLPGKSLLKDTGHYR